MNGYRWLYGFAAASVALALVVLLGPSADVRASAGDDSDHDTATCSGGSIAAGVYKNLNITGTCTVDVGSVTVERDLKVLPGGSLEATTGGLFATPSSDLTVGGNLEVQASGLLNLGCEPIHDPCVNDPDQMVGTFSTHHTIVGNLTADNAFAVVVHHTTIGGNVGITGGGGGIHSCHESITALKFAPPYGDIEDDVIGGSLSITGWRSCWLGMVRATVLQGAEYVDNVTGDPDGNEVVNNTVIGHLSCSGNNPAPQIGDSKGGPSTVLGHASGQCANPAIVH